MKRLIGRSSFRDYTKRERTKSVRRSDGVTYNLELLSRARRAWDNLRGFRDQRHRNIMYTYDDQWGDLVWDGTSYVSERKRMSERDGQPPLQNNHIIKIVRTLCGLYSKSQNLPVCFAREEDSEQKSDMMTKALQTNWERNSEKEVLTGEVGEMLVGGMPVITEEWSTQDGLDDSYTYVVNPDYFFYESKANDPRMWDVSMVGEIRDYTFSELCSVFAKSEGDVAQLRSVYSFALDQDNSYDRQLSKKAESWYWPLTGGLCRTYRVWTLEHKQRYRCVDLLDEEQPLYKIEVGDLDGIKRMNESRLKTYRDLYIGQGMNDADAWAKAYDECPQITYEPINDLFWKLTILTPEGIVIDEMDSPYEHKGHPYVFRQHELVNGKIYPFIGTVIDQQRYVNRLITLKDMYIRSMTKGLKLIPKNMLGGLSPHEFARQAVELNGWVFYEPDPTTPHAVPQVISQHASDLGIEDMIQLQVGWMNEMSSVSEALQGKTPTNGTPASRYLLETENSTTSISALIGKFTAFEREVARKKMKVIHQYYTEGRSIASYTSNGYMDFLMYDPKEVEDVEFDVSIKESVESPVLRMMMNDVVQQMWAQGAINAEQMLEMSYLPGSQGLLQKIRAAREQQEAQQMQMAQMQQGQQGGAMQQGGQGNAQQGVQAGVPPEGERSMNNAVAPQIDIPNVGSRATIGRVQDILKAREAPGGMGG